MQLLNVANSVIATLKLKITVFPFQSNRQMKLSNMFQEATQKHPLEDARILFH